MVAGWVAAWNSSVVPAGGGAFCGGRLHLPPAPGSLQDMHQGRVMVSVKSTAWLDQQRKAKVVSSLRNYAQNQGMNHLPHMFTREPSKSHLLRINSYHEKLKHCFSLAVECRLCSV